MYVRINDFRKWKEALGFALENGAFIAYFESMEIINPDSFETSASVEDHFKWYERHLDDITLYEICHLKELHGIAEDIIDGKIALENYVLNSYQDGSIMLNIEDIYRLRFYPKHLTLILREIDWNADPPMGRNGLFNMEDIEYEMKRLAQVPAGLERAAQLWNDLIPGHIAKPAFLLVGPIQDDHIKQAITYQELLNRAADKNSRPPDDQGPRPKR